MSSLRLYDGGENLFTSAPSLPLVGADRIETSRSGFISERTGETATEKVAVRLRDLGFEREARRLDACGLDSYRCKQTAICPRCGRRVAIEERKAIEADLAACPGVRALITRTIVPTGDIGTDRRALLAARRKQIRSKAWTTAVAIARGRIEVVFGARGAFVHAHEVAALSARLDRNALNASWRTALADEGASGSLDVGTVEVARGRSGFRPGRLIRREVEAIRAARADRRRASTVDAGRAWAAIRPALRTNEMRKP